MEIDKSQILELLQSRGETDKAAEADSQLPERFDVEQYADLLGKLGINVEDLLGQLPGGLGDKLGGLGGLGG